jgi:hypothetical protein
MTCNSLRSAVLFSIILLICGGSLFGGVINNSSTTGSRIGISKAAEVSGEVGIYGELYSISGRAARRPSGTARLFFRPRLTLYRSITVGFDFILSTEGSSSRQEINQFDINPKWSWGELHLGDFAHNFSPLTLGGINIRGGGVMLYPGKIRLSAISGIVKRPVETQEGRSYKREIYAGRIGIGDADRTSFNLFVLTARDIVSSLKNVSASTAVDTVVDSMMFDTLMDPQAVTPQENLVVSFISHIVLPGGWLSLKNEIAGCAITRDRRSSEIESDDIPEFLKNIFVPRVSSSADYAHITEASLKLSKLSFKLGYKYIGPGYVSLGLPALYNDQKTISGEATCPYRANLFKFDASLQQDNLINQKSFTTKRNRFTLIANLKPVPFIISTYMVNLTTVKNDAEGAAKVDYDNWILRSGQVVNFSGSNVLKNAAVEYMFQKAAEANPQRSAADMKSHTISIKSLLKATENLDLTPMIRFIFSRQAATHTKTTGTFSLNGRLLLLHDRLNTNGQVSLTNSNGAKSLRFNFKPSYQINRRCSLSGEIETNSYRTDDAGGEYDEVIFRINLTYSI